MSLLGANPRAVGLLQTSPAIDFWKPHTDTDSEMMHAEVKKNVAGWGAGPCPFQGFWIKTCIMNPNWNLVGSQHRKMETVVECVAHLFCKVTSEIPNRLSHLFPERMWLSTRRDTERWWTKVKFKCRINLLSVESLVEVVIKLDPVLDVWKQRVAFSLFP